MADSDAPIDDAITVSVDPEVRIRRARESGVYVVGEGERVRVPDDAMQAMSAALRTFSETPADAMPPDLREFAAGEGDGADGNCPECGSETVTSLGHTTCQDCGYVLEGPDGE